MLTVSPPPESPPPESPLAESPPLESPPPESTAPAQRSGGRSHPALGAAPFPRRLSWSRSSVSLARARLV